MKFQQLIASVTILGTLSGPLAAFAEPDGQAQEATLPICDEGSRRFHLDRLPNGESSFLKLHNEANVPQGIKQYRDNIAVRFFRDRVHKPMMSFCRWRRNIESRLGQRQAPPSAPNPQDYAASTDVDSFCGAVRQQFQLVTAPLADLRAYQNRVKNAYDTNKSDIDRLLGGHLRVIDLATRQQPAARPAARPGARPAVRPAPATPAADPNALNPQQIEALKTEAKKFWKGEGQDQRDLEAVGLMTYWNEKLKVEGDDVQRHIAQLEEHARSLTTGRYESCGMRDGALARAAEPQGLPGQRATVTSDGVTHVDSRITRDKDGRVTEAWVREFNGEHDNVGTWRKLTPEQLRDTNFRAQNADVMDSNNGDFTIREGMRSPADWAREDAGRQIISAQDASRLRGTYSTGDNAWLRDYVTGNGAPSENGRKLQDALNQVLGNQTVYNDGVVGRRTMQALDDAMKNPAQAAELRRLLGPSS